MSILTILIRLKFLFLIPIRTIATRIARFAFFGTPTCTLVGGVSMKILIRSKSFIPVLAAFFISACGAGGLGFTGTDINDFEGTDNVTSGDVNSTPGFSALVKTEGFVAGTKGANCPTAGGIELKWGLDNGRGEEVAGDFDLGAGEVQKTEYICNGDDGSSGTGYNSLISTAWFLAGTRGLNCLTTGGVEIKSGLDNGDGGGVANNGALEAGETDQTEYVCNGAAGADGADGTSYNSLISSLSFIAGAEGANCATTGGLKVRTGLDNGDGLGDPGDGVLHLDEVDSTQYICNGAKGDTGAPGADGADGADGINSLVKTTAEGAGANCAAGGQKIESGLDDDGDGVLDVPAEVDSTVYACNGTTGAAGADGADGDDGLTSLVKVTAEGAGANCAAGGQKIQSGIDADKDGVLDDPAEVASTAYACNGATGAAGADGADGLLSLVKVTAEGAGANCADGGQKVQSGIDDDEDGVLDDPAEIDSTSYVCNGANGGINGLNSLVKVTAEGAGANCAAGGQKIESGLDDDKDGVLDVPGEVDSTSYVCNGAAGADGADGVDGLTSLVKTTAEGAGANCTDGGQKVQVGIDDDDDGILDDPAEVDSTSYVCNGADGADGSDGLNSLIKTSVEGAGANCANGGYKIESGLDDDNDGVLDVPAEVDATSYACDGAAGADGLLSLVKVTAEGAGANCAEGGQKIQVGIDDDDDGVLDDPAEVDSTSYACNGATGAAGADGADGTDGLTSLVKITAEGAGANCAAGGQKIQAGIDDDKDGVLDDPAEVDYTAYACNGAAGADGSDGLNSLIKTSVEGAGANCAAGGQKIQVGIDDDKDGVLDDPAEVDSTAYACNGVAGAAGADGADGTDGLTSLVKITAEGAGANCAAGGQKIESGLDDDNDGVLDIPAEVDYTAYACNGADGADGVNSLITITAESAGVNCSYGGKRIDSGIDNGDGGGTSGNNTLESGEIDVTAYICNTGQAVLYQNNTDIGNTAGAETTLGTYTIPASTLARNGDYIEFDSVLVTAANNNSKRVRAYFGATLIYDSTAVTNATNNVTIRVHGKVYRTAAATQRSATDSTCSATAWTRSVYAAPAATLSNAIVIRITGLGVAANDVTSRTFEVGLGVAP